MRMGRGNGGVAEDHEQSQRAVSGLERESGKVEKVEGGCSGEEGDGEEERQRARKGMRLRGAEIGGGDGWLHAGGDGSWWWKGTTDGGNGTGESRWWQQWVK
ncbi:hypothetical protein AMTR_s00127p00122630 [Amborella trichopoda]|uniref:Uncharacterized protein n=1 Tax=Amborella trichopoda TaxID=13333 RepID=W1NRQ1_AMBTC|nr:hypothetical protein AMTR_s00127p00122630 [Amborella trichopoda]